LADINFAVWVCDFVNDFHAINASQVWATYSHTQDTLSQLVFEKPIISLVPGNILSLLVYCFMSMS
jgi:hypothetical protein